WIVANGVSTSTITVNLTNGTGGAIQGALIGFNVNLTVGSISPSLTTTSVDGIATAVFRSKTVSGTTEIIVSVNGTPTGYCNVSIDHDTPYSLQMLDYPNSETVGTNQTISVV